MPSDEPVTIESLNAALADLEREVRALSMAQQPAHEQPADASESRVAHAMRTATEDTVAASFVATEATIDRAGGWFVTLSELGAIQRDQAKALLKDSLDTLKALRNAQSPADVLQ